MWSILGLSLFYSAFAGDATLCAGILAEACAVSIIMAYGTECIFPNATVAGKKWPKSKIAAFAQFVEQLLVVMRAWTGDVVSEDVAVQRRAFGDGDVFGNDGIKDVIAIAFAQFAADVVAHPAPAVEAGEQVAALDPALEYRFEDFQRAGDVVGGLQRQVVGRYRDDQAVAGEDGVERQDADVWAAVDDAGAAGFA